MFNSNLYFSDMNETECDEIIKIDEDNFQEIKECG
jgi:hypothetical protein